MWVEFKEEYEKIFGGVCGKGPHYVMKIRKAISQPNAYVYTIKTPYGEKEYFDYRFNVVDVRVSIDDLL